MGFLYCAALEKTGPQGWGLDRWVPGVRGAVGDNHEKIASRIRGERRILNPGDGGSHTNLRLC